MLHSTLYYAFWFGWALHNFWQFGFASSKLVYVQNNSKAFLASFTFLSYITVQFNGNKNMANAFRLHISIFISCLKIICTFSVSRWKTAHKPNDAKQKQLQPNTCQSFENQYRCLSNISYFDHISCLSMPKWNTICHFNWPIQFCNY